MDAQSSPGEAYPHRMVLDPYRHKEACVGKGPTVLEAEISRKGEDGELLLAPRGVKTTAFFKDLLATVTTQNHGFPIAADDCQPTNLKM